MPPMMVRNTIGPISIFIAAMNVVPIGCMASPSSGRHHPRSTPTTMAISTCTYNCRYQGFGAGCGAACVIALSCTSFGRRPGSAAGEQPFGDARPEPFQQRCGVAHAARRVGVEVGDGGRDVGTSRRRVRSGRMISGVAAAIGVPASRAARAAPAGSLPRGIGRTSRESCGPRGCGPASSADRGRSGARPVGAADRPSPSVLALPPSPPPRGRGRRWRSARRAAPGRIERDQHPPHESSSTRPERGNHRGPAAVAASKSKLLPEP